MDDSIYRRHVEKRESDETKLGNQESFSQSKSKSSLFEKQRDKLLNRSSHFKYHRLNEDDGYCDLQVCIPFLKTRFTFRAFK